MKNSFFDNVLCKLQSYNGGSPIGIDVALEEINHLLEVDLSSSNRNIFKGKLCQS